MCAPARVLVKVQVLQTSHVQNWNNVAFRVQSIRLPHHYQIRVQRNLTLRPLTKITKLCALNVTEYKQSTIFSPGTSKSELVSDLAAPEQTVNISLSDSQKADLEMLFQKHPDVLGEKLGWTNVVEHLT